MYNFNYENQGTNTYLVYTLTENDKVDSMTLGMITNNQIPGFAPTVFTQMDTTKFIKFNISAKIAVKQFFTGTVNRKRLLGVFKGITDALLAAEDYMIDPNEIVLDLNYIYSDVATCETEIVCLPIERENHEKTDVGTFFKEIMISTQFDQTENCDYMAKIINHLNSTPVFSLSEFKNLLESIEKGAPQGARPAPAMNASAAPAQQPAAKRMPAQPASPARPAAPAPQMQNPAMQQMQTPNAAPKQQTPAQMPAQNQKAQGGMQIPGGMQVPGGMQIPGSKTAPPAANNGGKEMSLFYLLQHYNKDNAAAYKAQKANKKNAKAAKMAPPANMNQGFAAPAAAPMQAPGAPARPANVPPAQPMAQQPNMPPVQQPMMQRPAPSYQQAAPQQSQPMRPAQPAAPANRAPQGQQTFSAAVFAMDEDEGTVILGANAPKVQKTPYLLRQATGERIYINKPIFKIGRNSDFNDYDLRDNKFVGHSHCHIITRGEQFFIVDDNSRNHTFVDGVMITGSTEVEITHGNSIRIADEEFKFNLY